MRCAVFGCNNNNNKTSKIRDRTIRFFTFPKDDDVEKEWRKACGRLDDFINTKTARICSIHFRESDYARNLKYELLGYDPIPMHAKKLKITAVPTLRLPKGESLSKVKDIMEKINIEVENESHPGYIKQATTDIVIPINEETKPTPNNIVPEEGTSYDETIATHTDDKMSEINVDETTQTASETILSEKDSLDDETRSTDNMSEIIMFNEDTRLTDTDNQTSEFEDGDLTTEESPIVTSPSTLTEDRRQETKETNARKTTSRYSDIIQFTSVKELDEQAGEICLTIIDNLNDRKVPRYKSVMQQAACLTGVAYPVLLEVVEDHWRRLRYHNISGDRAIKRDSQLREASLVKSIFKIEQEFSEKETPSFGLYYSRLSDFRDILPNKRTLLHLLKLLKVRFDGILDSSKKDDSQEHCPKVTQIKSEDSNFESTDADNHLEINEDTKPSLDLLNLQTEIHIVSKEELPLIDDPITNEPSDVSGDVLLENMNTGECRKRNTDLTVVDLPENVAVKDVDIGKCQKDIDSAIVSLIKDINSYLCYISDDTPTLDDFYKKIKIKLSGKDISKQTVSQWLQKLNIIFRTDNVEKQPKLPVDPLIVSLLTELENKFWMTKLKPTLHDFYKELTKVKKSGFNFSKETVVEWLNDLGIKFYNDIPSVDYFLKKFKRLGIIYPRNVVMEWLAALNVSFKEKQELQSLNTAVVPMQFKSLIISFDEEYHTTTDNNEIDPVSLKIITNFEYNFHLMGKVPSLDCFYEGFISKAGKICSKAIFRNWLERLNIKYVVTETNLDREKNTNHIPTLDYFHKKLEEMDMKYSKQLISKRLKQLKIDFIHEKLYPVDPAAEKPQTHVSDNYLMKLLKRFHKQFSESSATAKNLGITDIITDIEYQFTQKSDIPTFDYIYSKISQHYKDMKKEVLIDLLDTMKVQYKNKVATLDRSSNVSDRDILELPNTQIDKSRSLSNKSNNNKYFIPTLDYFFVQFTKKAGQLCSKLTMKKWLNAIQIFYYPSKFQYDNTVPEINLNKHIVSELLKIEGEYQLVLDKILAYVVIKIKNQKEIQSLQKIHQYLQSFKVLRKETYYSKAMLRDWLNVKQIIFSEISFSDDTKKLDKEGRSKKDGVFVPTLDYFLSNLIKETGRPYSKYQVAIWLANVNIEFEIDEQDLTTASLEESNSNRSTKKNYDILIRLDREIRMEYLKFQLREIERTLNSTLKKPNYKHLHQIIENSNFFNYVQDPMEKEIVYKNWLKKMGISFTDNDDSYRPDISNTLLQTTESNITNKETNLLNNSNETVQFEKCHLPSTSKDCSETITNISVNSSNNSTETIQCPKLYNILSMSKQSAETRQKKSHETIPVEKICSLPSTSKECSDMRRETITNTSTRQNCSEAHNNIISYHVRFNTENIREPTNSVGTSNEQRNVPSLRLENPIAIPTTVFPHIKLPDQSSAIQLPQGFKLVKLTDLPKMELSQINGITNLDEHGNFSKISNCQINDNSNVSNNVEISSLNYATFPEIISNITSKQSNNKAINSNLGNSSEISNVSYEHNGGLPKTLTPNTTCDSCGDNFTGTTSTETETIGRTTPRMAGKLNGIARSKISTFNSNINELEHIVTNIPVTIDHKRQSSGCTLVSNEINSKNTERIWDISGEMINVNFGIAENQNTVQPIIIRSREVMEVDNDPDRLNRNYSILQQENETASSKQSKPDIIEIDDDLDETEVPKKKIKEIRNKKSSVKKIRKIQKCPSERRKKSYYQGVKTLKKIPQPKVQNTNSYISKELNRDEQSTITNRLIQSPIEVIELDDDSNDTPSLSVNGNSEKRKKNYQVEPKVPPCPEVVVTTLTDVEYKFHQRGKVPKLGDFRTKLYESHGNVFSKNVVRCWLKKIGIRFVDDRRLLNNSSKKMPKKAN